MQTDVTETPEESLAEVRRTMTICNACRYCEGLCATFQSMSLQRAFSNGDLNYLANLCHNCTACFHGCQYAPPHEFNVNVPRALASLRLESYKEFAWPGFMARLFERNGLVMSLVTAFSLAFVLSLTIVWNEPSALLAVYDKPGAFYQVISHNMMIAVAGGTFGFSVLAIVMGVRRFYRDTCRVPGRTVSIKAFLAAARDAATLKYLKGGHGEGCNSTVDNFSNLRAVFHHFTMWGFLLCFAATCAATVYDYFMGIPAPYAYSSVPVVLGSLGGIGLLIGPVGLFVLKIWSDPRPANITQFGMDYAFIVLLFLISLTGILLLVLRETSAMALILIVHLGFVLALFVTLPYSKFVHSVYRVASLLRFEVEKAE